jgi:hypothetical protein
MGSRLLLRTVTLAILSSTGFVYARALSAAEVVDWLRGTGKSLEVRLRAEVVNELGEPEVDARISGELKFAEEDYPLAATAIGNQFEIWLPVNRGRLNGMTLFAQSADGQRSSFQWHDTSALRKLAVEGFKIKVEPPSRQIDVRVIYDAKPVRDAWVMVNPNKRARTNMDGVARFSLTSTDVFESIMAWTNDGCIGGFDFSRAPERDARSSIHEVELSRCRNQKIRLVDENGTGVAGVDFILKIATPNEFNFIGTNENSRATTDAKGEASYSWFPDWKSFYAHPDIKSPDWMLSSPGRYQVDGESLVYEVKRTRRAERCPILVQIQSTEADVGGFAVSLMTYQSERDGEVEKLKVFTDATGALSVDALPESTYCAVVIDSQWISNIVDVSPHESASDQPRKVQLSVSKGTRINIQATAGSEERPYRNLSVTVKHPHFFRYVENGTRQYGEGGPTWYVTTDEHGNASLSVPRGDLNVSTYAPDWRAEKQIEIENVEPVAIRFHRSVEQKRTIRGQIVLAEGLKASLAGVKVKLASIDESTCELFTVETDASGEFCLDTLATELGVFAHTNDGKAAGAATCVDLTKPIEVVLRPTIDFEGQLLDADGKPRAGVKAWIDVIVGHRERRFQNGLACNFQAIELDATTDKSGNYIITGVPTETTVGLRTASTSTPGLYDYHGSFLLDPNDKRPPTITKSSGSQRKESTSHLAGDYEWMLRDCPVMNLHLMVILTGADPKSKEFAERNFIDYETNRDVVRYMQILVADSPDNLRSADVALMKERGWSMPNAGHVAAIALDTSGKELGRIDLDIADTSAVSEAADFVQQHTPVRRDAGRMWDEAFIEANRSDKRVIAVVGQRYCGPCFRLARWMHKHREILKMDYVLVEIMEGNDENSDECLMQLQQGKRHGVPFFAIYDKSGKRLVDSIGPLGNIGYPSGFDGKKWLRKMLDTTKQRLSDANVEGLIRAIED